MSVTPFKRAPLDRLAKVEAEINMAQVFEQHRQDFKEIATMKYKVATWKHMEPIIVESMGRWVGNFNQ